MDFGWSAEETSYRDGLRRALGDLVTTEQAPLWAGVAYDAASSLQVCRALAETGYLVPHWPAEWGGSEASVWHHQILGEEMWRYGEPRAPQYLNVNFIGPAIMRAGTLEQQREHLPRIAAGDVLWCQAFSEAEAGSDLSRIRTTARKVDGGYRISGTKTWISYADTADYCFLLAALTQPKRGASQRPRPVRVVFLTPMNLPGITVREIPSIVGPHTFHEVNFDNVLLSDDALLGDEETGWRLVTEALADERLGAPEYVQAEASLDHVVQLYSDRGMVPSSSAKQRLGEAYTRCRAARLLAYRAVDRRAKGLPGATAAYLARAFLRIARQACADAITTALPELGAFELAEADVEPLNAILVGVAGGSYEVLLDLVAAELTGVRRS